MSCVLWVVRLLPRLCGRETLKVRMPIRPRRASTESAAVSSRDARRLRRRGGLEGGESDVVAGRRRAVVAGVLLILATGSSLSSAPFLAPLGDADYLTRVAAHSSQVAVGALLASVAALTAPAIAVALYPVVRRVGEARAIGAV